MLDKAHNTSLRKPQKPKNLATTRVRHRFEAKGNNGY